MERLDFHLTNNKVKDVSLFYSKFKNFMLIIYKTNNQNQLLH